MKTQALPHSEEAERAVLAAVLLKPELFDDVFAALGPDPGKTFYFSRHLFIWEAFAALIKDGKPIDVRTVQSKLELQGRWESVGGAAFLVGLDLDLPDLTRAEHYAAIVRERAELRKLIRASQETVTKATAATGGEVDVRKLAGSLRQTLEGIEEGGSRDVDTRAVTIAEDVLREAMARQDLRKATGQDVIGLPAGIPLLDKTLSGLSQGLYILAGGPGKGKTSLALQIALHVAESGNPAYYVSFENSAFNLVLKALCGRTEKETPRAVRHGNANLSNLAQAHDELYDALSRLHALDGDASLTVARLRGLVRRAFGGRPGLIVLDYLQLYAKVSRELRAISDVRSRVEALTGELISLSKGLGSPVLCLSSQNRTADYDGGGSAGLATLKESGDLEYGADVVLMLTDKKDDSNPTNGSESRVLMVAKNREGPRREISLRFDPVRGKFLEESDRTF